MGKIKTIRNILAVIVISTAICGCQTKRTEIARLEVEIEVDPAMSRKDRYIVTGVRMTHESAISQLEKLSKEKKIHTLVVKNHEKREDDQNTKFLDALSDLAKEQGWNWEYHPALGDEWLSESNN